jgi:hypothetical protein
MALGPFSASNYLRDTSPPVSYPVSVSVWAYITNVSGGNTDYIWTLRETPGDFMVVLVGSGGNVLAQSFASTTTGSAVTGTGLVTNNAWNHLGAVFTSASSRAVYVNGGNKATNSTTVNVNMGGLDDMLFGAFSVGANALTDGYLAEMGVWNTALSDADMASLGGGFSCHLVQPGGLIVHLPGVRSPIDIRGNMAEVGTIGAFPHPPIIGAIAA